MKRFKSTIIILLLVVFAFTTGCSKKSKKEITLGKMDGKTYTNEYFGLTYTIPDSWAIATDEEKATLTKAGQEAVANGDEKLKKQLDLSKEKALNLVFAFKHPLSYAEGFNPNFFCIAENLSIANSLSIKSGADYLTASKELMKKSGIPYVFKDLTSEKLGGKNFDVMEVNIDIQGIQIHQKYYSTIIDGYALNFISSYSTDEELNEINKISETIKFE